MYCVGCYVYSDVTLPTVESMVYLVLLWTQRAWIKCVCVCVCVLVGLLRRKGGRMGERREFPKTHWIRGGRLLSTLLHAAAQRSKVHVFLDGLGYLLLLQYL